MIGIKRHVIIVTCVICSQWNSCNVNHNYHVGLWIVIHVYSRKKICLCGCCCCNLKTILEWVDVGYIISPNYLQNMTIWPYGNWVINIHQPMYHLLAAFSERCKRDKMSTLQRLKRLHQTTYGKIGTPNVPKHV